MFCGPQMLLGYRENISLYILDGQENIKENINSRTLNIRHVKYNNIW
jgi:hypothetical protein